MNLQELVQLYDMAGRTVVITGGAGILGSEMASALVGCRANVAILDRDQALTERLIHRIQQTVPDAGHAFGIYGDVLDRKTLIEADKIIQGEFGQVDALINAAGGNRPTATTSRDLSFFDLPEDALRFVFDLNILGTFLPCQVFGKSMAAHGEDIPDEAEIVIAAAEVETSAAPAASDT